MANITKLYSDIDFMFTKKPVVGDVALSYDTQAVSRSIRNLILTKHYERPFNPSIGSNMDTLLFEPMSRMTATEMESEIRTVINNYETRVSLTDVKVTPHETNNSYEISLTFFLQNASSPTTITMLLQRDR
jgi:phage baseplate assembly protein W